MISSNYSQKVLPAGTSLFITIWPQEEDAIDFFGSEIEIESQWTRDLTLTEAWDSIRETAMDRDPFGAKWIAFSWTAEVEPVTFWSEGRIEVDIIMKEVKK